MIVRFSIYAAWGSELTSDELSITMAVASGLLSGHVRSSLSRIDTSCDFWQLWSFRPSLSAAWVNWFLCLKDSLLTGRIWRALRKDDSHTLTPDTGCFVWLNQACSACLFVKQWRVFAFQTSHEISWKRWLFGQQLSGNCFWVKSQ